MVDVANNANDTVNISNNVQNDVSNRSCAPVEISSKESLVVIKPTTETFNCSSKPYINNVGDVVLLKPHDSLKVPINEKINMKSLVEPIIHANKQISKFCYEINKT